MKIEGLEKDIKIGLEKNQKSEDESATLKNKIKIMEKKHKDETDQIKKQKEEIQKKMEQLEK